jgi:predicted DNA-binding transcriptional regulator AlpA
MNRHGPGARKGPRKLASEGGESSDSGASPIISRSSRDGQFALSISALADSTPACDPTLTAGHIMPLLAIADLCRILGIDRRSLERMRSAGRLPRPTMYVCRRSPRWTAEVIRAWIEQGGQMPSQS